MPTVRIEIDRRHDQDCVAHKLPIAADCLPDIDLPLRLALQPVWRLKAASVSEQPMATQRLVAAKDSGHDARFPGVAMPIGIAE